MKVTGEQVHLGVWIKKKKSWISDLLAIDILSNWIDLVNFVLVQ